MFQNSLKWNLYGVKFVEEFEKYDFHKLTIFINLKAINHMGQFWIKDNFSPDIT